MFKRSGKGFERFGEVLCERSFDVGDELGRKSRVGGNGLVQEVRFTRSKDDLVINVGDVHDKVDIVIEVVSQYSSDNVLSEVVPVMVQLLDEYYKETSSPGMTHMR